MKLLYVPIRAYESQSDPTFAFKKTGIKKIDEITKDIVKKLISVTFFSIVLFSDLYLILEIDNSETPPLEIFILV